MASTVFVDGETLIEAAWLNDVNAAVYTPGTTTAADVANVPAGNIIATDVQAAINELDTEKQPLDALLISLAGQTTAADRIQGYSGVDTAMLYTVGTVSGNVPLIGAKSATESLAGLVELATQDEAKAGADDTVVMTPLKTAQAIPAKLNASGSAPIFACRAWVNFNGTGTVAIRASGNVSSITDNGTGDYTVNFTTGMPDANYAAPVSGSASEADHAYLSLHRSVAAAAGSLRVRASNGANTATDLYQATVAIFR